jgi:hypothetical protein
LYIFPVTERQKKIDHPAHTLFGCFTLKFFLEELGDISMEEIALTEIDVVKTTKTEN